jgi:hypothetical protein
MIVDMTDGTSSPALDKFLQSMDIGYTEWNDGIGFDFGGLRELGGEKLQRCLWAVRATIKS